MQEKIIGLELLGIPGSGKSYLLSGLSGNKKYVEKNIYRKYMYKNIILKLICIPFVLIKFNRTISFIYSKRYNKNRLALLKDYFNFLFYSERYKNDLYLSIIHLLHSASINFIIFFINTFFNIQYIVDEGFYQKALGLIIRRPDIDFEILLNDFNLLKIKKYGVFIIKPNSRENYFKMLNSRARSNVAILRWCKNKKDLERILFRCDLFLKLCLKNHHTFDIINGYDSKSKNKFIQNIMDLFKDSKVWLVS